MVNGAPVANDQPVTAKKNNAVATTLTRSDVHGDPLTFSVLTGPSNGSLSGTAPNLTYTPNAGFNGIDTFTYKATDGVLDSNEATVGVTVNPAASPGLGVTPEVRNTPEPGDRVRIYVSVEDASGNPVDGASVILRLETGD